MQLVDIIHTNYKKYKSYNDVNDLEMKSEKPKIVFHPAQLPKYPRECVSYSVFLQKNQVRPKNNAWKLYNDSTTVYTDYFAIMSN
jgi:hypothetical protein